MLQKPIYLLADSLPLFQKGTSGQPYLASVSSYLSTTDPHAVYLGASNGDDPRFFQLFCAGMEKLGISNCVHLKANASPAQQEILSNADLIFLAGGEVKRGWTFLQQYGLTQMLKQRYAAGAILMGLSAGAMQLGNEKHFFRRKHSYVLCYSFFPSVCILMMKKMIGARSNIVCNIPPFNPGESELSADLPVGFILPENWK